MNTLTDTIIRPRITEKAALSSETLNAYVFEIAESASKENVAKAIKSLYKVNPIKINIVRLPAKQIFSKGRKGFGKSVKKAYVYLKKGEKIDIA